MFLLDSPYLPPTIEIFLFFRALEISKYNGSPPLPGSLVRSNTAIFSTVSGKTLSRYFELNGRYRCTSINPMFSLLSVIYSLIVSVTDPIATIIFLAFLLP